MPASSSSSCALATAALVHSQQRRQSSREGAEARDRDGRPPKRQTERASERQGKKSTNARKKARQKKKKKQQISREIAVNGALGSRKYSPTEALANERSLDSRHALASPNTPSKSRPPVLGVERLRIDWQRRLFGRHLFCRNLSGAPSNLAAGTAASFVLAVGVVGLPGAVNLPVAPATMDANTRSLRGGSGPRMREVRRSQALISAPASRLSALSAPHLQTTSLLCYPRQGRVAIPVPPPALEKTRPTTDSCASESAESSGSSRRWPWRWRKLQVSRRPHDKR